MAHGATALCVFVLCVRDFALKCVCMSFWVCVCGCVCVCCAPWPLLCCYAEESIAQLDVAVVVCRIVVVNRCVGLLVMAG